MNDLEKFYFSQSEPNKSVFLALKDIIFSWDENIEQCLKYGLPCFTYQKKILCYLWQDKKTKVPYVLFNYSNFIEHQALDRKGRKLMQSMDIFPDHDIPIKALTTVFNQLKQHINSLKK